MGFASYFLFFITTIIITCIRGRAGDWCLSIRRGKQGVMASFQGLLLPPFCPSTVKEYTFDKLRAQLLTYASTLLHTEEWFDLSISVPTATTSIPVDRSQQQQPRTSGHCHLKNFRAILKEVVYWILNYRVWDYFFIIQQKHYIIKIC
jgi:hypothetical protein